MRTNKFKIPGYDGRYSVSRSGEVTSHIWNSDRVLKPATNNKGRLHVRLYKEGKVKSHQVSRLVALCFLKDFDEGKEVDHIDGDKKNNTASNLRMVTRSENLKGFQSKKAGSSSRYRGVSKAPYSWRAEIKHRGKMLHLGNFKKEDDAAKKWNEVAMEMGYKKEAMNKIEEETCAH
jgi:hypothetical protein